MEKQFIDISEVKSVLQKVGIDSEECEQCMTWTSPELDEPLTSQDTVIAELTPEEQGFLRCMDYVYKERGVVDLLRLKALYQTFWTAVRSIHHLPLSELTVKEGRYIVRG